MRLSILEVDTDRTGVIRKMIVVSLSTVHCIAAEDDIGGRQLT